MRAEGMRVFLLMIGLAAASESTQQLSKSATRYLSALRRKLGISMPGHNISLTTGVPTVLTPMQRNALVLVVPPSHVITVSKALGSGGGTWINSCALKLPRTLPRHFVLAMYVLHERYLGRADSLMRLWLENLPAIDTATVFWTDSELNELEEERAIRLGRSRRASLSSEYETMVRVLLDDGCSPMADDLEDAGLKRFELDHYLWAATIVSRHAYHFADDFPVLLPLALRFHPHGAVDLAEWGDESNPGASLYVGSEVPLHPGEELTVWSGEADNAHLLVNGGYVWETLATARVQMRLSAGVMSQWADDGPTEAMRREWLSGANWTQQMDFELAGEGDLNPDMLTWLRMVLASPLEVRRSKVVEDFRSPLSLGTEQRVFTALRAALEKTLGRYEYSIEEDEQLLESATRGSAPKPDGLAPRRVLAVTYRLLCKRVIQRTIELAARQYPDGRTSRRLVVEDGPSNDHQTFSASVTTAGEVASAFTSSEDIRTLIHPTVGPTVLGGSTVASHRSSASKKRKVGKRGRE